MKQWRMAAALGLAVSSLLAGASFISLEGTIANRPSASTLPLASNARSPQATTASASNNAASSSRNAGVTDLVAEFQEKRRLSPEAFLAALAELAKRQPELAVDVALACGPKEENGAWVATIIQDWSRRDPRKSWQWLTQQRHRMDDLAEGTLPAVTLQAMAATDRKLLLDTVDSLLDKGETTGPFATQIAAQLGLEALVKGGHAELALQTIERWINNPAKPNIGAAAYETVASSLAVDSPQEATRWLLSLPHSETRTEALANFAGEWGTRDPKAALSWAQGLSAEQGLAEATHRSFVEWVERSPSEASDWLDRHLRQSAGNADSLIEGMIELRDTSNLSPHVALQWANRMADTAARVDMETRLVMQWSRTDLAGARDHVWNSATISPERKQRLLQDMKRPLPQEDAE